MRCRCCDSMNAMRYTAPSGDVDYLCIDCRGVVEFEVREDQADLEDLGSFVQKTVNLNWRDSLGDYDQVADRMRREDSYD